MTQKCHRRSLGGEAHALWECVIRGLGPSGARHGLPLRRRWHLSGDLKDEQKSTKVGAEHSRQKDQQVLRLWWERGGSIVKKQLPALSQSIPQHLSFQTQHTLGLDKDTSNVLAESQKNVRRAFWEHGNHVILPYDSQSWAPYSFPSRSTPTKILS